MSLQKTTHLFNYNTTNATNVTWCWPKRPCYRLRNCLYCRRRKRKKIIEDTVYFTTVWDLQQMATISVCNYQDHGTHAVKLLQEVRRKFNRRLFKGRKFIAFLSVDINSSKSHLYVPHFHFLIDASISKLEIAKALKGLLDAFKVHIHIEKINRTLKSIRRLAGYLMDRNFFETLKYAAKRVRLITASRGFSSRSKAKYNFFKYGLIEDIEGIV